MDLKKAVVVTRAYGEYFKYPLSADEIHHWLITSRPVSKNLLKQYQLPLTQKEINLKTKLQKNTEK